MYNFLCMSKVSCKASRSGSWGHHTSQLSHKAPLPYSKQEKSPTFAKTDDRSNAFSTIHAPLSAEYDNELDIGYSAITDRTGMGGSMQNGILYLHLDVSDSNSEVGSCAV